MTADKSFLAAQIRAVLDATPDLTTVTERGIRDQIAANNPALDVNANKALIKETIKDVFIKVVGERSAAAASGHVRGNRGGNGVKTHGGGDEEDDEVDESEGDSSSAEQAHGARKKQKGAGGFSSSSGGGRKAPKHRRKVKREPNPNNPFNAPLRLSEPLAAVVGAQELSRPQIVKAMWEYIKKNDLQDKEDRRFIVCDARLTSVFNTDRVHMFTMNKIINNHILKGGGEPPK